MYLDNEGIIHIQNAVHDSECFSKYLCYKPKNKKNSSKYRKFNKKRVISQISLKTTGLGKKGKLKRNRQIAER